MTTVPTPPDDHALAAAAIEPRPWDHAAARPAAWTFVAFLLAWMAVVFTVWTTWPGQDHGTRMADSNILNAGRNFDRGGLLHRHGVPQLETYEDDTRRPILYGTYPPGPYWVHALLRQAGIRDLPALRGASVVGATLAGLLALAAFAVMARSWLVGALAGAFYCFSAPFSGYADSLHMNVWMQIGLFCFLLAWVGFERARTPWRWAALALAAAAYFFEVWMTLEHIVLIAIVVAVRTIASRRWSVWAGAAALAAVAAVGLASRLGHLALEFGSIDAALDYLKGKLAHRSGEGGGGSSRGVSIAEVVGPWLGQLYWSEVGDASRRREFGYPFLHAPVLTLMAALLALMASARIRQALRLRRALAPHGDTSSAAAAVWEHRVPALRSPRAGLGWGILILAASLHWHIGMRQHAMVHPHVILNMLPGMALILGSLTAAGLRLAMPDARAAGWWRWLGVPLALALTLAFGAHLRNAAVLNRLFPVNPRMHAAIIERELANEWWRDLGAGIDQRLGPVRRVVLYHWGPRQANLMGLPHQYVEGGVMPEPFGGNADAGWDILLVEFPRRQRTARVALEDGFDRFGMPEIAQGFGATTLLFSDRPRDSRDPAVPATTATLDCDVRFEHGLRIERIRLSRTITGDDYALCFLVRAPNAAAFAPGAEHQPQGPHTPTVTGLVRTLDNHGERTGIFMPRLANRATFRNRSLVWVVIDRHRLPPGGSIRIALTGGARQDRLAIVRAISLPDGMHADLDTGEIVWNIGESP